MDEVDPLEVALGEVGLGDERHLHLDLAVQRQPAEHAHALLHRAPRDVRRLVQHLRKIENMISKKYSQVRGNNQSRPG